MSSIFLTAEWRKLVLVNYAIDAERLRKFVPAKTEIDLWNGTCYVSLVGFMFLNTRLKGFSIPFHNNFPEVNLRFYVRYRDGMEWKRGVCFIKEIVPRPALTFVANSIYGENYETMKMRHSWDAGSSLVISYEWLKEKWHKVRVVAENKPTSIKSNSEEEFITEHFWGYTRVDDLQTSEYQVEHPRWEVYHVEETIIDVDFGRVYGDHFDFLRVVPPRSVFLAEGSEITVRSGRKL